MRPPSLAMFCAALLCAEAANAQSAATPSAEQRRSAEANEPTGVGGAAAQDAEAVRRAREGWWAKAAETRDARLAWWREARFGAFVHWGPYSVLGGRWRGQPNPGYSEHIMRVARIPRAVYRDEVAARFRPDAYDAKAWAALMKAAGMRYVIITAKHHDGFALWPSDASDYNIAAVSGWSRDPLGELVSAARAEGLRVGFYYSHAFDWEDPDAPGNDWDYDNPGGDRQLHGGASWWNTDPAFLVHSQRYVDQKAIPQLKELIARYHPDILWFDTPGKLPFFQQAQIVEAVRAAGPEIVINGRAARNGEVNLGDYQNTADRPAEVRPTPGDWEAIPTTNESYGYNALDHSHKPPGHFVQLLARSVAKGGNILLNIGPRGDGSIDAPDVAILEGIARWMSVNGESIHGAGRTPLDRQAWGDSTVNGPRLYLHVFRWPKDGKLVLAGLTSPVLKAYLLADPRRTPLKVVKDAAGDHSIATPEKAPDPDDSVIVVETEGPVSGKPERRIDLAYGANQLLAFDAEATGAKFAYGDGKAARYYVDGLERPGAALTWRVRGAPGQRAKVSVRYSTVGAAGGRFVLRWKGRTWSAPVTATSGPTAIATLELGEIDLTPSPSPLTLTMSDAAPATTHVFELLLDSP